MTSIIAFSKFVDFLDKELGHGEHQAESYFGPVLYTYGGRKIITQTKFMLFKETRSYGKIYIHENDAIKSDSVHTEFLPDYQVYRFDNSGALSIVGESTKMSGAYEVVISASQKL